MRLDPIHRRYHHNQLTFGQLYAYTENFLLPLSHDEVVHGKGSLLDKMPGDAWQEFANLRLLFAYQFASPGKKLNFMGNELAQGREWRASWELDWGLLAHRLARRRAAPGARPEPPAPRACLRCTSRTSTPEGFSWIDCHDADQSTLSFVRRARDGSFVVVVLNFTPVPRARLPHRPADRRALTARCSTATRRTTAAATSAMPAASRPQPLPWMGLRLLGGHHPAAAGRASCCEPERAVMAPANKHLGPVRHFRGRAADQDRRTGRRERLAAGRADALRAWTCAC